MITLTTTGLRDAQGRYARYSSSLERAQIQRLREEAERVVEALRAEAPRGVRTEANRADPHMADSITYRIRSLGPGRAQAQIIAEGPHADLIPLVVEGSPPHVIRSRRGRALAFEWPNAPFGTGGIYFFRKVNHPGTRPNPFIERAWQRTQAETIARLRQVARDALGTMG